MSLYHLKQINHVNYDENDTLIVRAKCGKHARSLANEKCGDEGKIWDDDILTSCDILKVGGEYEVVIINFNAG